MAACTSRATPSIPRQSGRFARHLQLEHLGRDRQDLRERRAGWIPSDSSTMIPLCSLPIASSSSARIIPPESTPRSLRLPSVVPSGMTAPGFATATV